MAENKTVRISAEDAGFSSMITRASKDAKVFMASFGEETTKTNRTLKEQITLLERKIAIERNSRSAESSVNRAYIEKDYSEGLEQAGKNPRKKKEATDEYKENIQGLNENKRYDEIFLKTLTEKLEQLRLTFVDEKVEQRKLADEKELKDKEKVEGNERPIDDSEFKRNKSTVTGGLEQLAGQAGGLGNIVSAGIQAGGLGAIVAGVVTTILATGQLQSQTTNLRGMIPNMKDASAESMGFAGLGLGGAEGAKRMYDIARARGKGGNESDLLQTAKNQIGYEKGFGLSDNTLTDMNRYKRADTNSGDVSMDLNELLQIYKNSDLFNVKRDDFTIIGEKLENLTRMNQESSKHQESFNSDNNLRMMAAFDKIGGSAADFRQGDIMSGMNNAISNPGNDASKAFIYQSIQKRNPGMSVSDIIIQMQKGMNDPKNIKGIIQDLDKNYGGGENGLFAFSSLLRGGTQDLGITKNLYKGRKNLEAPPSAPSGGGAFTDSQGRDVNQRVSETVSTFDVLSTMKDQFSSLGYSIDHVIGKFNNLYKSTPNNSVPTPVK